MGYRACVFACVCTCADYNPCRVQKPFIEPWLVKDFDRCARMRSLTCFLKDFHFTHTESSRGTVERGTEGETDNQSIGGKS